MKVEQDPQVRSYAAWAVTIVAGVVGGHVVVALGQAVLRVWFGI